MKKLNRKSFMLFGFLLSGMYVCAQNTSPSTFHWKILKPGEKAPNIIQKFNPTLKTNANPPAPGLVDGPDVRIFPSTHVQSEVIIAINKANPQNLLASANTLLGSFNYNQGYYSSTNGGATWSGS